MCGEWGSSLGRGRIDARRQLPESFIGIRSHRRVEGGAGRAGGEGVTKQFRHSKLLWAEGQAPDWVVDVRSTDARTRDRTEKRQLYARLGVLEYFLCDPVYKHSQARGTITGIPAVGGPLGGDGPRGSTGSAAELESELLELSQRPDGKRVRLRDLRSGEDLLFFDEPEEAELAADKERDQETDARRAAEARVAESEAVL